MLKEKRTPHRLGAMRLDVFLVNKGFSESRSKAEEIIKSGKVKVNGKVIKKPAFLVEPNTNIEVESAAPSYVSRGGEKLAEALKIFQIDVKNKTCLDIGASTGGFTDCLLKNGAKLVYAVDVGKNQLHPSLRKNEHVVSFEETDIRNFSLPKNTKVDFVCVDVSFISVIPIVKLIKKFLKPDGEAVILIKPQFEVGRGNLNKRGVVKNPLKSQQAVEEILKIVQREGYRIKGPIAPSLKGKAGNQEFLLYLKKA
ncbi:MAG TPA: TlyA family RNA methyltransferase [Candidatus Paceibacterota bacterium]|nr:TlyA family RNA methyltransferase [Candidatus Paceibacterota bacterium]HOL53861.1 TlyA family RNA methyltransferase [Candidatus Paceibacterota bacterium]HON21825.1 TlyA family RNA methyltransferase [Candidatus Paceibacterota bacterium]HPP17040.1 TlyA family RNA methyltransferase [Candidatus Paceibacterota bacterium]